MGQLYSLDLPNDPDRKLKAVLVKDPSTNREYFLRVPPSIKRPCASVIGPLDARWYAKEVLPICRRVFHQHGFQLAVGVVRQVQRIKLSHLVGVDDLGVGLADETLHAETFDLDAPHFGIL